MIHLLKTGLLIGVSALAATACAAETGANSATFLPGVAADPLQTTLFTAGSDGRLIAINSANGEIRWRSKRQLEALAVSDGTIVASATVDHCANCLQLVWLSTLDGREQRRSQTITLPEWVAVAPAPGKQFTASTKSQGSTLLLHWQATRRYVGGARPNERVLADSNREASGTLVVDVEGRATVVKESVHAGPSIPSSLRNVTASSYWDCSDWRDRPIVEAAALTAFAISVDSGEQVFSATRWQLPSGQLNAKRRLVSGANLQLQVSPDERFIFVYDGKAQGSIASESNDWQVFSLETLRRVASVPYPSGPACSNVAADNVVMLIEKSLPPNRGGTRSRDLEAYASSDGKLRWSVKLRGVAQQPQPR